MEQHIQKRSRGRPRKHQPENHGSTVQALDRGITLLSSLARQGSVTLTELALQVGMPASSAHRLLMTMQQHGIVDFNQTDQTWAVGVESFRIGSSFTQRTSLVETGRETLRHLMEETGETANMAVPDGHYVIFVGQVETSNPIRAFYPPGTRGHMHASGIGKVLLAEMMRADVEQLLENTGLPGFTDRTMTSPAILFADLEVIRSRGWSLDDEERYAGMRCVASPIFNSYGEAIAGVSVSGPAVRFPDYSIPEIGPKVRRSAENITQLIGGRKPEDQNKN